MFTGLIEAVGEIVDVTPAVSGGRLRIRTSLAGDVKIGDSLAVNGVCLTVVRTEGGSIDAEVGPETARVTTLGSVSAGQTVNLERSMRADGRFGGHFVQGHADGTGVVERIRPDGDAHWLTIAFSDGLSPYLIPKGSIAVDGISLTIAALHERTFDVMIVPHTWHHTMLPAVRQGDRVNLECDMLGKYVARAVEAAAAFRRG
jgi:riboflavin synthase